MVPKFSRRDSAETVSQMVAAARQSTAAEEPAATDAQVCADTFVRSRTETGCLRRGRRLMAQACQWDFGDGALKRSVVGATVEALQTQSPKFQLAWATLTRPQGPYGLPPNVTLAHIERQPCVLQKRVCANRVQQWERDFRLQLATSGVLARLVLLRALGLSQTLLTALATQPAGIERCVADTIAHASKGQADAQAHSSLQLGTSAAPLNLEEQARWHGLMELDRAQQRLGYGQHSGPVRALLARSQSCGRSAFALEVRSVIAAFAGVDVPASIVFYESLAGQRWLAKQTELSYTELGKLWDAIDRHTQRIDRWIRTMA